MKDFDFNPEYSTSDLVGGIVILRELADTKLWKKKPFDPAHALVDLHMLANNAAGEFKTEGGGTIAYQPGWCIWSNRGLAERWGWRQESVESFLKQLEELEVVRRHATGQRWKAIELVQWRSIAGASPEHERSVAGDGGELGVRSKELGEGGAPPRMFTLEAAQKYFSESGSGYTPAEVAEQWSYYDAIRDPKTGDWRKPRGQTGAWTPISDPRSELANALLRFAGNGQKKNAAARTDGRTGGRTPAMARFELSKKLAAARERLDACHETGAPPEPGDEREERELQEQLEKIGGDV